MKKQPGWIGIDLDGTLAHYRSRSGIESIGNIIGPMQARVEHWLTTGFEVRIFTARATDPLLTEITQQWLQATGLPALDITNRKDFDLLQIWDDRAVQVKTNSAELLTPKRYVPLNVAAGWIGVELDGTLAHFDEWKGPEHIGEPIPVMLQRVKQWLMAGIQVKLFTARAIDPDCIISIRDWLKRHGLDAMDITHQKDFSMAQFWDDRAIHVISNSGQAAGSVVPDMNKRYIGRDD
jgi:hypothetical protein